MTTILLLMSMEASCAQEVTLRADLCKPAVVGEDDLLKAVSIPAADDAFLQHRYRLSFKAYYQFFFCFAGYKENLHPGAEDSGAAPLLRDALSAAYDEDYRSALPFAKKAFARDARFGEAMLIAGNLERILGNAIGSHSDWELARETVTYPDPDPAGTTVVPLYVRSADRFLARYKRREGRR